MGIFAIGDLHLSFDKRIAKPMDIFGKMWENHGEKVKGYWLDCVSENDIVIIPGDISWGLKLGEAMADLEWIHNLPGKKIITKGNHDLWWTSISKLNELFSDIYFLQNESIGVSNLNSIKGNILSDKEKGIFICGTRGWICPGTEGFSEHDEKIYLRELLRLQMSLDDAKNKGAKEIIVALHYPPTNDKHQLSGFTRLLSEYNVKTCIYGHLHGKDTFARGLQGTLNGVEYKLVSLDYLKCKPLKIR